LVSRGCSVQHILLDGTLEPHAASLARLLQRLGPKPGADLFGSAALTLDEAYEHQGRRIAYDRRAHRK